MLGLLALNPLSQTDIIFFVVLAAIVVLCIVVYFLIPIINKKQYKELRDNLQKREAAFKSNIQRTDGSSTSAGNVDVFPVESAPEEQPLAPDDVPIDPTEHEKE